MIQSPARQDPRTALGSRFRRLWAASAASNLGDGVWLVAAPLLAATLTGDPMAIAGLAVAQRLPWLLFPLLGGALADRVDRRRAMVAVALARAALALFGVHAVVWGSVLAALRQELTPDRLRGRVASVHGLIENGSAAPGALLGGVLASTFGLTAPFWLGAVVGVAMIPFVWPIVSDEAVATARAEAAGR